MSQLQLAFPRGVILIQLQKANGGGQVFRNFPIIILPKTVVIYRDKLARQVFVNWQPPTKIDILNLMQEFPVFVASRAQRKEFSRTAVIAD